ncbi:MAG: hypothetical protein RIQ47_1513 [Bacteroidota bacterium]|jgi:hypothetical protein
MDYRQYKQLLSAKGSEEKPELAILQEFVNEFPYCQTGQLLLTRSMYLQDHVRYEQQLKRTAIAVPDRTALFNLIHSEPAAAAGDSPLLVGTNGSSPFQTGSTDYSVTVNPEVTETEHPLFGGEVHTHTEPKLTDESALTDYLIPEENPEVEESTSHHDPHEIVRERLEALLAKKETSITEVPSPVIENSTTAAAETVALSPNPVIETTESPMDTVGSNNTVSNSTTSDIVPELDLAERETALESSILRELEQLPVIEKQPVTATPITEVTVSRNFSYWVKQSSGSSFGKFEEIQGNSVVEEISGFLTEKRPAVETTSVNNESTPSNHLIERFIATEPRIVPQPKAEFYNPALQAKRSVEEHDDLVSETLARIYADQGNLQKARLAYEKLGLLRPEKSAYFAALIQKIDNQLNSEEN